MRALSRRVAEAYLEQRQRLEYPFLKDEGGRMKAEAPRISSLSSFILHPSSFLSNHNRLPRAIGKSVVMRNWQR
jgi:hypothetical protein